MAGVTRPAGREVVVVVGVGSEGSDKKGISVILSAFPVNTLLICKQTGFTSGGE